MGNILTLPRRGDDRRQLILKEAQVARLYGEDTLRDIAFQSESMPFATPLGFGCGSVYRGDWRPARKEFVPPNRRYSLGDYLSIALSLPFCGFSSLSALINEATVNSKRDSNNWWQKTLNPTTTAGAAYWTWMWAGYPSAGVIPAAGLASTAQNAATAGAFGQANAPGSNTKHLLSATATSTVAAGALLVHDMTLLVQPVLATTTQQVITGSPTRYQTNGNNGVLPFSFLGASANATTPTITITYTESTAGTTGHSTGGIAGAASAAAYRSALASGGLFFPLQAGDVGVRRIESTTHSTTYGTSPVAYGMAYPYCWIPVGAANAIFGTDLLNTQFNLVQVVDGACIAFILMAATTSSGVLQGELVLVSGNS